MNSKPQKTTTARYQRIGILWLLSALLTLIVVYSGYRLYLAHKIKVKIGQIRQAGLPVTLAELNKWYAVVPPEENAALILTNAFAHFVLVNTNTSNLPIIGRGKLPPRNEPLSPEMKQAIADYLATNQVALELLQKGLAMKSCRYPVDLTPGYAVSLPHLAGLKKSIDLVRLKLLLHIENGELEAAVQSVETLMALSDTLLEEPMLVSHLVRVACQQMARQSLERLLCRARLNEEYFTQLDAAFTNAETASGMRKPLAGELCSGLQVFGMSNKDLQKFFADGQEDKDLADYVFLRAIPRMRFWGHLARDELFFLDSLDAALEVTTQPLSARLDANQEMARRIQEMKGRKYPFILSRLLLPGLQKAVSRDAVGIGYLHAAQAALAIERYRIAHADRRPESLSELLPNTLNVLPSDPFDGRPIRYKKLAVGYVVYSVGTDLEDDGGKEKQPGDKTDAVYDLTFTVTRLEAGSSKSQIR